MDWTQLKLFIDLVRAKNFTKVAQNNFLTQPAVSCQIRRLEEELGVRLFERTNRRVGLTDEGRIFLPYANDVLRNLEEVKARFVEREGKVVGMLKIATTVSIGLYILPNYLKQFIKLFPSVDLHLEYQLPERIYDLLHNGEVDLGVVAYFENRRDLISIPFMEDEMVIICSPNHPWANKRRLAITEIKNSDFIALAETTPTGKSILRRLKQLGIHVRVKMEYDNIEIIKKSVEMGLGIALVPKQSVIQEAKNGTLASIRITDVPLERPLSVVYWKGKVLSKPMQSFIHILTAKPEAKPEAN